MGIMENIETTNNTTCTKCGQPVSATSACTKEINERLEQLLEERNTLQSQTAALQRAETKWSNYLTAYEIYGKNSGKREACARAISVYQSQRSKFSPESMVAYGNRKLHLIKNAVTTTTAALIENERVMQYMADCKRSHADKYNQLEKELQLAVAKKEALEDANKVVDLADLSSARTTLEQNAEYKRLNTALTSELDILRSKLAVNIHELRTMHAGRRKVLKMQHKMRMLECAKQILHRDKLQARLISSTLLRTCTKINAYLAQFGFRFSVSVDTEEFSFTAIHIDGHREPAVRLSTGQKMGLSIAFWLARSAVYADSIPFFCLDEPTANLDDERVTQSASIFNAVAAELSSSGRQGFVITHHLALATAGSARIDIATQ
jgi:DNA repair exonuclease SbcCD ATPase subunit